MAQQILEARSLNALLLTDLASDLNTSPQVEEGHELREGAEEAAVSDCLGILPEDVAWAEIGDDAGRAVVKTTKDSVTPLARHDAIASSTGRFRERPQRTLQNLVSE